MWALKRLLCLVGQNGSVLLDQIVSVHAVVVTGAGTSGSGKICGGGADDLGYHDGHVGQRCSGSGSRSVPPCLLIRMGRGCSFLVPSPVVMHIVRSR